MFSGALPAAIASAVARDAFGVVVTGAPLLWTTGDSTVLTVDAAGAVRAWQEGATTLRVASGSAVATKQVRTVYRRLRFGALRPEQITMGSQHGCALDADGHAWCWGSDSQGQLGRGSVFNPGALGAVTGGHVFTAIEARDISTCGLTTAKQLRCWGRNAGATRSGTPTAVLDTVTVQAFAVGMHNQSCAIGVDAVTRCWGHNDTYQLGRGPLSGYDAATLPVAGSQRYKASVSLGGFGGCAIGIDDSTWCWGDMNGVTPGDDADRPVKVAGAPAFVQVESFVNGGSCGRTANGEVWCWGENSGDQLGFSTPSRTVTPIRIAGLPAVTRIDTGYGHGCGLTAGGELWCWGGLGTTDQGWRVASGTRVARFAAPLVFRAFATASSGVCGITVLDETICSGNVPGTGL
jgi:alpha-tubulin suppressor-like RCC1 family protein